MLMARMASARMPDEQRRARRGPARLPETRAICAPNGSRPSRAIANSSRMHAAITASVQTVMAIAESMRKMLPSVLPSACLMM